MAVCAFLGHDRIHDDDLYDRTMSAVERVAEENQEIEFTFSDYRGFNKFLHLGFFIAQKVKQKYPQKNITTSVITEHEKHDEFINELKFNQSYIPSCFVDRVLAAPPMSKPAGKSHDITFAFRKLQRWEVMRADYLVSYLYPNLEVPQNQFYRSAKANGANIFDVTSPETTKTIEELSNQLSARRKMIYSRFMAGETRQQISQSLGITASAVQQSLRKSSSYLQRLLSMRPSDKRENTCCILLTTNHIGNILMQLRNVMQFLIRDYHVGHFTVLRQSSDVSSVTMIQNIADYHARYFERITVEEVVASKERFLLNAKAIIDKNDFCICALNTVNVAYEIKKYTAASKQTVLVDLR